MDHFPCQWLLVLVWLKPLFPSVFLVQRREEERREEEQSSHLTSAHSTERNALVILLHWTLSSNLHIANNKIIDRIVDHKHFTSFQIGFYTIFTTIRYLRCKDVFLFLSGMVERYFLSCMILEKDIQNYIWFILLKILIVIQIQFIYLEMFLKQSTKFFSFEKWFNSTNFLLNGSGKISI